MINFFTESFILKIDFSHKKYLDRLLLNKEMRTNELIEKSQIHVSKFHVLMKGLVACQLKELYIKIEVYRIK